MNKPGRCFWLLGFLTAVLTQAITPTIANEDNLNRQRQLGGNHYMGYISIMSAADRDQESSNRIEVSNMDKEAFSKMVSLQFSGRLQQLDGEQSQPLIFQKISVSVPQPQLFKRPDAPAKGNSARVLSDTTADTEHRQDDVPAEWGVIWYGEILHTDGMGSGSASFIMDAKGELYGTITDGFDSYTISSAAVNHQVSENQLYKYTVVSIQDLPDEIDDRGDDDDDDDDGVKGYDGNNGRKLQQSFVRGGFGNLASPSLEVGETRKLQIDNSNNTLNTNATTIVDVAVIYTEAAKLAESGDTGIHNLIGLSVFQTNMAFRNSGSNIQIRLISTIQDTSFPDNGTLNGWAAAKNDDDGYFDYWQQVKNETGADGIMFIVNSLPGWCGRAQSGGPLAIVSRGCAAKAGRFSFAHELGHWFNAGHDSMSDGDFDNRGFIDNSNCFRTLMAYANCNCTSCPRVLYFSNNQTDYEGFPLGGRFENNIRNMELNAPLFVDIYESYSQALPIELCQEDPCEEAPILVSTNYNGDGRSPHIPGNNLLSSVRVPHGVSIEVFDKANFEGLRRVFGQLARTNITRAVVAPATTEPIIGATTTYSLVEYGMDNQASSFIVRTIPTDETATLCSTWNCLGTTQSSWTVGSYARLGKTDGHTIGEDTLSRVILSPGWQIEVFEERMFRGESLRLSNDDSIRSLSVKFRNRYGDWNNRVRSMIVSTL